MRIVILLLGLASLGILIAAADVPSGNMQIFTPNGRLTVALTGVNYMSADLSGRRAVRITSSTTGIRRHLPSAAKGSYPAVVVDTGSTDLGINIATPFLNLSGVTGTLEVM